MTTESPQPQTLYYAGFWGRFCALWLDMIVLSLLTFGAVCVVTGTWPNRAPHADAAPLTFDVAGHHYELPVNGWLFKSKGAPDVLFKMEAGTFTLQLPLSLLIAWLYFAGMESSRWQGTLGKLGMGYRVTDLNGQRIGFLRATGRFFAKFLSGVILLIGYFIAAWTPRKRALHDYLAGSLVCLKPINRPNA